VQEIPAQGRDDRGKDKMKYNQVALQKAVVKETKGFEKVCA
jgi:hypothetical protein